MDLPLARGIEFSLPCPLSEGDRHWLPALSPHTHTNAPRPRINQGHDGGLVAVPYRPDQRIGAEDVGGMDIGAEAEQNAQHSLSASKTIGLGAAGLSGAGWGGFRLVWVRAGAGASWSG